MSVRICLPSKSIFAGRLVGALARLGRAGPEPGHVEHPAAGGDDLAAVAAGGARVGDLDALAGRVVEPADHVALRRALRVSGRREHHGHRPVVGELRLDPGQAARLARGLEEIEQVGAQPRQHRLGLRVAEAGVELEHLGAVLGEHQARRRARRGRASRGARISSTIGRWTESAISATVGRVEPRDGRVAAHAAGVRAPRRRRRSACSPAPGASGTTFVAVAERQQRELLAVEVLLEHDLGLAEAPLDEEGLDRGPRLGLARRR